MNSGLSPWATLSAFFCDRCFQDRVSQTICPGWLQTMILLLSGSWVAGITSVSTGAQLEYNTINCRAHGVEEMLAL
jgi:hypothetical protein